MTNIEQASEYDNYIDAVCDDPLKNQQDTQDARNADLAYYGLEICGSCDGEGTIYMGMNWNWSTQDGYITCPVCARRGTQEA